MFVLVQLSHFNQKSTLSARETQHFSGNISHHEQKHCKTIAVAKQLILIISVEISLKAPGDWGDFYLRNFSSVCSVFFQLMKIDFLNPSLTF